MLEYLATGAAIYLIALGVVSYMEDVLNWRERQQQPKIKREPAPPPPPDKPSPAGYIRGRKVS